ncbi:MAG: hypothetical protein Q7V48_02615, partial [Deltaproteobacteria bacterium]|nr:hypothetical protein [Deltaproteobacteria bacterium]
SSSAGTGREGDSLGNIRRSFFHRQGRGFSRGCPGFLRSRLSLAEGRQGLCRHPSPADAPSFITLPPG